MSERSHQRPNTSNGAITAAFDQSEFQQSPASSSRSYSSSPARHQNVSAAHGLVVHDLDLGELNDSGFELDDMVDGRPGMHRGTGGLSEQPLLHKHDDDERGRTGFNGAPEHDDRPSLLSRRSTMRSRSPDTQARMATKKKYMYAAFFLVLSLISFTVQTETAVYIQHELKWNKAYCMLSVTPSPPLRSICI